MKNLLQLSLLNYNFIDALALVRQILCIWTFGLQSASEFQS